MNYSFSYNFWIVSKYFDVVCHLKWEASFVPISLNVQWNYWKHSSIWIFIPRLHQYFPNILFRRHYVTIWVTIWLTSLVAKRARSDSTKLKCKLIRMKRKGANETPSCILIEKMWSCRFDSKKYFNFLCMQAKSHTAKFYCDTFCLLLLLRIPQKYAVWPTLFYTLCTFSLLSDLSLPI